MDHKFSAIIEARMLSSRLEGKVLKKIHNKEILRHIIERVKKSGEMIYNKKEKLTDDLGAKPK